MMSLSTFLYSTFCFFNERFWFIFNWCLAMILTDIIDKSWCFIVHCCIKQITLPWLINWEDIACFLQTWLICWRHNFLLIYNFGTFYRVVSLFDADLTCLWYQMILSLIVISIILLKLPLHIHLSRLVRSSTHCEGTLAFSMLSQLLLVYILPIWNINLH